MRRTALAAASLLERAAAARLRATHAELIALQSRRILLLERSSDSRRRLRAGQTCSAFVCTVVANHLAKCATLSADNLARQRSLLARGEGYARLKLRWAAARVGLTRRLSRSRNAPRWPD